MSIFKAPSQQNPEADRQMNDKTKSSGSQTTSKKASTKEKKLKDTEIKTSPEEAKETLKQSDIPKKDLSKIESRKEQEDSKDMTSQPTTPNPVTEDRPDKHVTSTEKKTYKQPSPEIAQPQVKDAGEKAPSEPKIEKEPEVSAKDTATPSIVPINTSENPVPKRKKVKREDQVSAQDETQAPQTANLIQEPSFKKEEYEVREVSNKTNPLAHIDEQKAAQTFDKKQREENLNEKNSPSATTDEEKKLIQASLESGPVVWLFTLLNYWQLIVGILIGFLLCKLVSR